MQTQLADFIRDTRAGREAEEILRRCVHCGFCTATCPTYQLTGDELDGPRGRIYLIKQMLEGGEVSEATRNHLDRCLTCRSCETTCPSGVEYGRLVEIGRAEVERQVPRRGADRVTRWVLRELLPRPQLFAAMLKLGRMARPLLPAAFQAKVLPAREAGARPAASHPRRMLALAGCVQPSMAPSINAAAARVLDALGVALVEVPEAGCCGAVRLHLNDGAGGMDDARRNVDAWWPLIERRDVEAIVMTASACGLQVRDYGHLLAEDRLYAERAARVSALVRDISEVLADEADAIAALLPEPSGAAIPVAFHSPCTLQHGLKVRGVVEALLARAGYAPLPVADSHLCCGSAGTYSVLQPALSGQLQRRKVAALTSAGPALVATANIGCLAHLSEASPVPVRHWIELIDARLRGVDPSL